MDNKEGKKEHKKNWREVYASVEDIKRFLDDRVLLRYNVVTHRIECRRWGEFRGETHPWLPISDRLENSLWAEMQQQQPVRFQDMQRVIESDHAPDYHPFRDYLEHLPPWDGQTDPILAMSVSVQVKGGVDEQMLFARCLKKWLVAMVAGWVDDEVVNNVILILIGRQGIYKTTWFSYLLPPELRQYFYTKSNAQRITKDDLLSLSQYGLVCCEELDTMRPSELNQLKAAVTMTSINERAAYARHAENRAHIATFCGTGNNVQFLSDVTGNRRWLPFEVDSILSPREMPFDYEAVYAQAYGLYRQGFQYWFSQTDIEEQTVHNEQFEAPKLEQELIQQYFRCPAGQEPGEFLPVSMAMQMIGIGITQKLSEVKIGRAFKHLGFQSKVVRNTRGYVVVRRSADEMRSLRMRMAMHTDTDDTDVF